MVVCDAYKPIVQEYQRAMEEDFENMSDYTYVKGSFGPTFPFYRGNDIYYAKEVKLNINMFWRNIIKINIKL